MSPVGDALAELPEDARERLEAFARVLERIHVDDLSLHVARQRQPRHRQAVETAELVAIGSGLGSVVQAARNAMVEALTREYAKTPIWRVEDGMGSGGSIEERVRVAESVANAVTALVLWDRLDDADRGELLGLWDRLLP